MDDKEYLNAKIYDRSKMDELAKKLSESLDETDLELIAEGINPVERVKIIRELTGWSLSTAVDLEKRLYPLE